MYYDPIKHTLGNIFNTSSFLRSIFYFLLDLLLLRTWYVHKEIKKFKVRSGRIPAQGALNILDAGSGFGQYTYWLSKKFSDAQIVAVDIKEEQVADCNNFFNAIGKKNVKFEVADLTKFFQESKFNLVLSVDVMEHILEDVIVFRNFYTSLKQGGMLLISTPSDNGGSDVHNDNASSFIEEHVRNGYNIKEIVKKLHSAGFSKTEAIYSYGAPGKISWRLSMKYPIQMLGITKLFFIILPFYYVITYPISFLLNYIDVNTGHKTGTGLIVKAWK